MRKRFTFIVITFILTACESNPPKSDGSIYGSDLYSVSEDDVEMNEAIEAAKRTLHTFDSGLLSKSPSLYYFALKIEFTVEEGTEHIWVARVSHKNSRYIGVVDNPPQSIQGINAGDTIEIDKSRVTDWMYLEDGKLKGGYTIRVARKHMTRHEQEAFDREYGIIVED